MKNAVERQLSYCTDSIKRLEAELENCPEGQLFCHYNGCNYSWRIKREDGMRRYLPKKIKSLRLPWQESRCSLRR